MSGSAHTVVQAQAVQGGLHLHRWRPPVPRQLPAPPRRWVNRIRELELLTAAAASQQPIVL